MNNVLGRGNRHQAVEPVGGWAADCQPPTQGEGFGASPECRMTGIPSGPLQWFAKSAELTQSRPTRTQVFTVGACPDTKKGRERAETDGIDMLKIL